MQTLIPLIFAAVMLALLGLFLWIIVTMFKTNHERTQAHLHARPGPAPSPAFASSPPTDGEMWWYARVGPSTLANTLSYGLASRRGILRLSRGTLSFAELDATEPAWSVPVSELKVKRVQFGIGLVQDVRLESPTLGTIGMEISREPMPIWDESDLKELRDEAYADQFVGWLLAAGARPLK